MSPQYARWWAEMKADIAQASQVAGVENLPILQELQMDQEEQTNGSGKRRGSNKQATSEKSATIPLTADQLAKLWEITVGGRLIVGDADDAGNVTFYVSQESFTRALPVLLARL